MAVLVGVELTFGLEDAGAPVLAVGDPKFADVQAVLVVNQKRAVHIQHVDQPFVHTGNATGVVELAALTFSDGLSADAPDLAAFGRQFAERVAFVPLRPDATAGVFVLREVVIVVSGDEVDVVGLVQERSLRLLLIG